ncbi:4'-phosphopantetheinyl transferase superfamily protein [Aquibacillus sp. 3ASR75-11]|uniref:4'-phosphopantetheinyl transferase superfamily protein n=1 Tax=Terrihalobacillus insolitus TaxID=2950438 RepID=A0A9X4AM82_9BACI|nr:4'-phosphopantetheinyl transferase superfamily protein [Terrihalobacillus insolitus]MDC3425122.1 4'-phosphopantetheinyl transferase superfamily protein [Terrihalobacillus insolitus]
MNSSLYGTGIDIVDKRRISQLYHSDRVDFFLQKWFNEYEIDVINSDMNPENVLALFFGIKEAFIKASNGIVRLKDFKSIKIHKNKIGYSIKYTRDSFLINRKIDINYIDYIHHVIVSVIIFEKNQEMKYVHNLLRQEIKNVFL